MPSVCRFDPCLIYQAPRWITVGIQRCEATKFVAFSQEFSRWPYGAQISQSGRFRSRSQFESSLLRPPRSIRCCFCSLTEKCFRCPVRSRRGGAEDQEAQKGPTDSPTVTAGWVCQSGRADRGLEGGGACIIHPWQ